MEISKNILLTGAGFTKTFGGYLADEMWAAVFNQPQIIADPKLRSRMLKETLNYEAIYEDVINSDEYTTSQKSAFTDAMRKAYDDMDQRIYERRLNDQMGSAASCCTRFISRFSGDHRTRGFFFTLNQDIFVERFFSTADHLLTLPGLHHPKWFNDRLHATLAEDEHVTLPSKAQIEKLEQRFGEKGSGRFVYVKLHGSYTWKAQNGSDVMVIGYGKEGRVRKEPLLSWYLSLFEKIVQAGGINLVVVGYGFGDHHINDIIANAMQFNGLRLFVISPRLPQDFQEELSGTQSINKDLKHRGHEIWQGLYGYYCGPVTDLYYPNHTKLPAAGVNFFKNLNLC